MRPLARFSYLLLFLATACLDRIYYDVPVNVNRGISIYGAITDEPGPYEVTISRVFDIESKDTETRLLSALHVYVSDNTGVTEELTEFNPGHYRTTPTGIRGVVGGVYKLTVEMSDGRIYESLPDTIMAKGSMDSLYTNLTSSYTEIGTKEYGMDVRFNATYNSDINSRYVWQMLTTFESKTQPELYSGRACNYNPDTGYCNYLPICSGIINVGTNTVVKFERKFPCTCCLCWYNIYNEHIILSDDSFTKQGKLDNILAQNIPLNEWTLQYKIRVNMQQLSLTRNSFRFWKALRDQKDANNSIFQPITGVVPSNFVQVAGKEAPITGLFYATAVSKIVKEFDLFDMPVNIQSLHLSDKPQFHDDCRYLFPSSTNVKPPFWID